VAWTAALLGKIPPAAPLRWLLALRSDGIKDLAKGYLHEKQWSAEHTHAGQADEAWDPELPAGIRQLFVAATLSRSEGSMWGRLVGDLLVGPASAGDRSQDADVRWLGGMNHFDLLCHDRVYDTMLRWLRDEESAQLARTADVASSLASR
jgi:hypothetical protein